eukprot:jgi/Psemu1/37479/gm1.37479_g
MTASIKSIHENKKTAIQLVIAVLVLGPTFLNLHLAFNLSTPELLSPLSPIIVPVSQDDQFKNKTKSGTRKEQQGKGAVHSPGYDSTLDPGVHQRKELRPPGTSIDCRKKWDLERNRHLINKWLEMELPILVTAIRHHRGKKTQDRQDKVMDFQLIPWVCLYSTRINEREEQMSDGDDYGNNYGEGVQELAALSPRTQKGDHVIVMCNSTSDNSTMVLKGIFPTIIPFQISGDPKSVNGTKYDAEIIDEKSGRHYYTRNNSASDFFYDLQEPLECDRLEEHEMSKVHEKKKIDNNHSSHFPHHYNDYKPKLSQEPAQWSCVFNARKYGYDWVISTDADEFVHVPKVSNGTTDVVTSPLQSYLKRFDPSINSCLIMNSIPFGRNNWLQQPDFPPDHFLIDYVWRRNLNLSEYPLYRYKQIYNPQHVWSIGVHYCFVSEGRKNVPLNAEDGLFLQHFKLAHKGVYKKLEKIMVKSELDLLRDSALRDMYRSDLAAAIDKLKRSII